MSGFDPRQYRGVKPVNAAELRFEREADEVEQSVDIEQMERKGGLRGADAWASMDLSSSRRDAARAKIAGDIELFLSQGGKIEVVE